MGSMPKLEHVKLMFRVHKRECLNGVSDLGIQHLSALSKVEVEIKGGDNKLYYSSNYDPTEDKNDDAVRWVASTINGAIMTHPNRPSIRFEFEASTECQLFEIVSSLPEPPALMIPSNLSCCYCYIFFFHLLANTRLLSYMHNALLLTPSSLCSVLTFLLEFEEDQSRVWGFIDRVAQNLANQRGAGRAGRHR